MNDTKWNELRCAMLSLEFAPKWSTLSNNGYQSPLDREWFYHFREGGYDDIIHVDIHADNKAHRKLIEAALLPIHLPGVEMAFGFRIFGYVEIGKSVHYL